MNSKVYLFSILVGTVLIAVASASSSNGNDTHDISPKCKHGLVIPKWMPDENLSVGDRVARGLVYFIALVYLFVGVSIIADRFMAAIEVITSQEKEITIKRPKGETQTVVVRVWNETVANLTLMALGSSAPEILLSVIEICGSHFEAGELGPGTIVGSAAFNLFIIMAICVYVIPNNQVRRIKHLRVFFITASWSLFAYIWLYMILKVISPNIIEVWEAVLTFMFFPATVVTAYIADRRFLIYKYLSKNYRMTKRGMIVEGEGDVELQNGKTSANHVTDPMVKLGEEASPEMLEFEENRRNYINILKGLRHKHPNADMDTLEAMAREEIMNQGPKSRAFYRIQATRKLTGGGNVVKKNKEKLEAEIEVKKKEDDHITRICFDPGHYTVMENVGEFEVNVAREGGDLGLTILVDYRTEDGSANAGSDYEYAEGTLVFQPGETAKGFRVSVIDDDVFEEDEHFYVRLSNIRIAEPDGTETPVVGTTGPIQLVAPSLATVMILDDDHGGIFSFLEREFEVPETIGEFHVKVSRFSGARGRVSISYATSDGTAKAGKHYEHVEGELIFENNEPEQEIVIHVIDEDCYEKDIIFFLELGEPKQLREDGDEDSGTVDPNDGLSDEDRIALLGRPRLGDLPRTQVRIKENKEFKNTVDKLIKKANVSFMVGTSSWKEQFMEAITVSAGEDDEEGEEGEEPEEKLPSCGDYVMHFVTIFWKVIFAFVPPTDYLGGWACFVSSILLIGVLTGVIGDVASSLGCTIHMPDPVTAITLVALGTSVPDTFASKVAAVNDKYADSSIGNVTGSNAVNVFLGLGIAWSMAAIYHAYVIGDTFYVDPGNLAFSVTLFCSLALVALVLLVVRRHPAVGGELGGPAKYRLPTTILFVSFWLTYVLLSSLESYKIIQGF